jgi:hypothetical protein
MRVTNHISAGGGILNQRVSLQCPWYEWKRQLADGASAVFEKGSGKAEKDGEALVGELYKQIGQQKVELDFLARKR